MKNRNTLWLLVASCLSFLACGGDPVSSEESQLNAGVTTEIDEKESAEGAKFHRPLREALEQAYQRAETADFERISDSPACAVYRWTIRGDAQLPATFLVNERSSVTAIHGDSKFTFDEASIEYSEMVHWPRRLTGRCGGHLSTRPSGNRKRSIRWSRPFPIAI